jgi:hypothetical protein
LILGFLMGAVCLGLWMEGRNREALGAWKREVAIKDKAIVALAQVTRTRVDTLRQVRITHDRILADTTVLTFSRGAVITLIERERAACDSVIAACKAQVVAARERLDLQIKKPGARRFPVITAGAVVGTDGRIHVGLGVGVRIF